MSPPSPSGVVSKVALLLRLVSGAEPSGVTTSAVARAAAVNRSTAHRLLHELQAEGLVDRDSETANWVLGPETYLLGTAARPRYDVAAFARPFVRQLAVDSGESAFFSVRRGMETVCLMREDGSFPLRSHVLYEGLRLPLGVASAGLAILAFMDPRDVAAYLQHADLSSEFGAQHSHEQVRRRLAQTQRAGYSLNPGLLVEGSWGMGAAVFDGAGSAIGALSLTGVEHRFASTRQPELGRLLLEAAHGLTTVFNPAAGAVPLENDRVRRSEKGRPAPRRPRS